MAGEPRIVAIDAGSNDSALDSPIVQPDAEVRGSELAIDPAWTVTEEPEARPSYRGVIAAGLAGLAIVGWTGFFGWATWPDVVGGVTPQEVVTIVGSWSLPVLLVCLLWLLVMRTSRREAARFNDAARQLGLESVRLEQRLATVNSELSLAREFIAAQSRDLDALGRIAAERLSEHADRLDGLIKANGSQIDAIASVSGTALENMERLRGSLPVIVSSAKDVTNHIGNAGRAANQQLQDLISGFNRLNEFGQASERQTAVLHERIEKSIGQLGAQLDSIEQAAAVRFAALDEQGDALRTRLDTQEVEALAAIRSRAAKLAEEIEASRRGLDEQEAESLTSLRARLGALRDESTALSRALRESEGNAVTAYRQSLAAIEDDLVGAFARLEELDRTTGEAAAATITGLHHAAERLDGAMAERVHSFHEDLERRRALGDEADAAAIAAINLRLADIDQELERRQEASRDNDELAVQSLRERLALLDGEIATRRTQAANQEAADLEGLRRRLALLDEEIVQRQVDQEVRTQDLIERTEAMALQLDGFSRRMQEIALHGDEAGIALAGTLRTLATGLAESRGALDGTGEAIGNLTDASVRLLELIQASASHAREDLPLAIGAGEERLAAAERRLFMLRDVANEAVGGGEALEQHLIAAQDRLTGAFGSLEELHDGIAAKTETTAGQIDRLTRSTHALQVANEDIANQAQTSLREAIEQLAETARAAVDGIESDTANAVTEIAGKLGEVSAEALDRVMRERASEVAEQLEQAAARAAGASRDAAVHLRDQLAMVNELAGNLERRVAQARDKAQERVDNDFARRSALITESLNSHAIDIAKALDHDVSDTAWAAYLKGDRGIFSRRAVRLLDTGEARSVLQIYEKDREFREHVSRYIHDFEGMLRQLLATRDGHSLSVTLLSSDLGKLYVALAQAIERLRD